MASTRFDGIIFDMDGTLTVPVIDFGKIRSELGISEAGDLAEIIDSWPDEKRKAGWALIEKYEHEALEKNKLQPNALEVLKEFRESGIRLAILTRNTLKSVEAFTSRINFQFDISVTREFPHIKPSPEPVKHVLRHWNLEPQKCLMVGDYIHDIEAGRNAGTASCFFFNQGATSFSEFSDYTVTSFKELRELVYCEQDSADI